MQPGQVFAHFEIVRRIGEGGMGEVFLARDQKLNRQVAIKTLHADVFDRPEGKERFKREATTAASISHPNVTSIYDIGTAHDPDSGQDTDYIVMEYVEGRSLKKLISDQRLDMPALLHLAEKLAGGLAAAHRVNVVHRDLKPENIIIDSNDDPKILDFGLAKPVEPLAIEKDKEDEEDTISKELTRQGTVVGTVSYMSPEQAQGELVDSRSDVFSFGILLYRLAAGKLPFTGSTQVSIMAKILETQPEPPSSVADGIPRELERIIDKCLQKDPADRYQDTRDLVVDLRRLRRQYDSGVSESVSTVSAEARKRSTAAAAPKHRRLLTAVVSLVAALLVTAFIVAIVEDRSAPATAQADEPGLAILGFENKTGDETLDWLETGLPEILLTDLAQGSSARLISQRRVLDCLETDVTEAGQAYTHQECVEAARTLGATNVLSGSFYKVGDLIRIDARLEEISSGKILFGEKVIGSDPFTLVDSLTGRLTAGLQLEGISPDTTAVASVTTSSPEAYKHYLEGLDLFLNGHYENAIAELERALEYDSAFALPYMRIGMAHLFQGHLQEGASYLSRAKEFEQRLPADERSLLDIYIDLWVRRKFDAAMEKLELQVRNFPDDKESKTMLALVIGQLTGDTTRAFRLLDDVLAREPGSRLALAFYADLYMRNGNLDKAVEYTLELLQYHPESAEARKQLAAYYSRQGKFDQAKLTYARILDDYPNDADVLINLHRVHIKLREFDQARTYLDRLYEAHKDDPYQVENYYSSLAGLANWEGKFKTAMTYRFKALEAAQVTQDSSLIHALYEVIAEYYRELGMPDSAYLYSKKGHGYAAAFNTLDFPMTIASLDTNYAAEARPMFRQALNDVRGRVPTEMFPLTDAVEELFEAQLRLDTTSMIAAQEKLVQMGVAGGETNVRSLGIMKVLFGQYEEGREILKRFTEGEDQTVSGYMYPYLIYLIGVANHELGDLATAEKNFTDMLSYWDDPEIELKEIKDARRRLAELRRGTL